MFAGGGEGAGQAAEGVRRADADHQVERIGGDEARGIGLVQGEPVGEAALVCGARGVRQSLFCYVHAVGAQLRVRGQRAQQPLRAAAPQIEHVCVVTGNGARQQSVDRILAERDGDRVVGVGDAGELGALHGASLAWRPVDRIRLFPLGPVPRAVDTLGPWRIVVGWSLLPV